MKITPMTGGKSLASKVIVACLLLLAATNNVIAETEMVDEQPSIEDEYAMCDGMNSCEDCLGAIVCDYYQGGECSHYELRIADIRRYTVDRSTTIESVCERAALDEADQKLCSSQTDCESCTSTVLSDGVTTCTFHPELGWCLPDFCTMIGCGERTCSAPIPVVEEKPEETTTIDCSSKTSCEECVGDGDNGSPYCAWVPVFFYEQGNGCTTMSCDTIADPDCFSREFDQGTAGEICTKNDVKTTDTSAENASSVASAKSMELIVVIALLSVAFL